MASSPPMKFVLAAIFALFFYLIFSFDSRMLLISTGYACGQCRFNPSGVLKLETDQKFAFSICKKSFIVPAEIARELDQA